VTDRYTDERTEGHGPRKTAVEISTKSILSVFSPVLTLKQHISRVCVSWFYQLRQIRYVRRSLDDESTATLVHAFVASRIDYCCSLLFGSPKTVTDKLQRVLNAAARVVTNTRKYDRGLHHTMRHDRTGSIWQTVFNSG